MRTNAQLRNLYIERRDRLIERFIQRANKYILHHAERGETSIYLKIRDDVLIVDREINRMIMEQIRQHFPEIHIASKHIEELGGNYTMYIFSWKN